MKLQIKTIAASLLLIGSVSSITSALASVLPPASSTSVAVGGPFGGVLQNQVSTFVSTPTYSGWAHAAVYKNSGGTMDFYYQFDNLADSRNGIVRITGYDYTGFTTDVYQTAAAFGIFQAGTQSINLADRGVSGVVGFNFLPTGTVSPGKTSYTGIVRTNAEYYQAGSFGIIDGFTTNAVAFAPAVPEPETYGLMLLGLGLVGFAAKRRNRADNKLTGA